jgi:hypothetical protein
MARIIVSSCGTSLLTKNAPDDVKRSLWETANESDQSLPHEVMHVIAGRVEAVRHRLVASPLQRVRALSAELNGILGIHGGQWPADAMADQHYLLHTDTFRKVTWARLVAEWLNAQSQPKPATAGRAVRPPGWTDCPQHRRLPLRHARTDRMVPADPW